MNTTTTTTWSIDTVEAAMAATTYTEVGYLSIGRGRATLPSAKDGWPVSVPVEVALEAIQRYQGHCWVAPRPTGGCMLVAAGDPVSPEPLPEWLVQEMFGASFAEEITARGLVLWWVPALRARLWLGAVLPDGRAAGVSVEDDTLRVGWVVDGKASSSAFVDEAPTWAMEAIASAREVLGV